MEMEITHGDVFGEILNRSNDTCVTFGLELNAIIKLILEDLKY